MKRALELHDHPEKDSLDIALRDEPGAETREIADGLNVDLNADGIVVGFDIDRASQHLDLTTLEAVGLPARTTPVA